jgi:hypothetical protein
MNIFITDDNFVEWVFAVIGLILGFILSHDFILANIMYELLIRWTVMWFSRKIGLNLFISLKKKYNIKNRNIVLLPFPKII